MVVLLTNFHIFTELLLNYVLFRAFFCEWCCREVDVYEYAYFKAVSELYNMQLIVCI